MTAPIIGRAKKHVHAFSLLLDRLRDEQNKLLWVEKTPKHFQYLAHIDQHIPNASIIHIVRDGRAVAASVRKRSLQFPTQFGTQRDPIYAVNLWNNAVQTALRRARREADYVLLYEQFAADPECQLRRLTAWMGITYEPTMLDTTGAKTVRAEGEQWKKGITSTIQLAPSQFKDVFSATEQRMIERSLDWESYKELCALAGKTS